ncbi:MAG TPA: ribbon-helix-helix protein, CopG family [Candidatus Baltobacteraceae bacterium]|nr:ribbon-helix-helix protein, CopG family [Candidatus Baltobacteraceae bacterium]
MALRTKKTEAEHIRDLEKYQDRVIEEADLIVQPRKSGLAPISIRLSEPLLARLDRIASREHRTRSNLIQHILWEYVHEPDRKKPR